MRRRRVLATALGGVAGSLAGCRRESGGPSTTEQGPPRLAVDGNWLVDPDGNRVTLRGVNVVDPWWGTTYADLRNKDYWETVRHALDDDAGWHTQVLRLPIEPRSVREAGMETILEHVDRAVEETRERDAYLIVDYHAVERYDTAAVDQRVREFWKDVAPRYADETHVLYELFNEPTEPWGNGLDTWKTWRETAQPWVDLIRNRAPETPIVVGSPRWSSTPRHAAQAPFEGNPICYSAHVFPSWSEETWEPTFGAAAVDVPLFLTEWGYINVQSEHTDPHMVGSTSEWGRPFKQWVQAHASVNWCAWVFDSYWQPRMFDQEWNLLTGEDYMGGLTKSWLAEARERSPPSTSQPPGAPSNFLVSARRPTRLKFTWDAGEAGDAPIVQYRVTVDDRAPVVVDETTTSNTVSGLRPGTEYEVSVVAVDGSGARSEAATLTAETATPADPVATIPRTESPPTIDAEIDDVWANSPAHPLGNVLLGSASAADLTAEWRALWDADALYVLVEVTDDDAYADSSESYKDDAVELYLDPDHSRGATYDGENDAQLVVVRGKEGVVPGANSVDWSDGVAVAQTETDGGWRVELAVPWGLGGVEASPGKKVGMDVHAIDDEDGGGRELKRGWYATTDDSWQTPRAFATVVLGGAGPTPTRQG